MKKYIYIYNGVINKIEHVIHYELQHHGSICAHVIFWVKKEYVKIITNAIVAFVLVALTENINKFIKPTNNMKILLYKLVIHKQLHSCQNRCM
jgi:hypothetical protein